MNWLGTLAHIVLRAYADAETVAKRLQAQRPASAALIEQLDR